MNDDHTLTPKSKGASETFLQLVRKRFSHDLRGPLGTVVNYAAIIEDERTNDWAQVREYAARIRSNAMRAAAMLQQLSAAVGVIGVEDSAGGFEVAELLREAAVNSGHDEPIQLSTDEESPAVLPGNPALTLFSIEAFLRLQHDLTAGARLELDYEATLLDDVAALSVWRGARPTSAPATLDIDNWLRDEGRRISAESGFSLRLAQDLAHALGGDFELRGRPSSAFGLWLRWPCAR